MVSLNLLHKTFLNFAKSSINKKKWRLLSSFLSYKHFKLKLKVFIAGNDVAMETCYIKRMTITCGRMGHLYDTNIVESLVKQLYQV